MHTSPSFLQHFQGCDTWTAEESSSSSSWVKVFLLHKSSLVLLQYCCHSFSNCFPCCAKCFSKKYISKVLQQVTVKNNSRKQKQMKKTNSWKKSRSLGSRCLELTSYTEQGQNTQRQELLKYFHQWKQATSECKLQQNLLFIAHWRRKVYTT